MKNSTAEPPKQLDSPIAQNKTVVETQSIQLYTDKSTSVSKKAAVTWVYSY